MREAIKGGAGALAAALRGEYGSLDQGLLERLLELSAATIDRLLAPCG